MPEDVFKKLLEFEKILKKCIIDRFHDILPQNKIDIINNTEYLNQNELSKLSSAMEIQGKILKDMLDSIIDIKFIKDVPIDDFTQTYILFAEDIETDIIEYYSKDISVKYKFNVNFTKNDFPYANEIKALLGDDFDYVMFNKNTEDLLNDERLKDFSKLYEIKVISQFNKANHQSPIVEIVDEQPEIDNAGQTISEIIELDNIPAPVYPNAVENSNDNSSLKDSESMDNSIPDANESVVDSEGQTVTDDGNESQIKSQEQNDDINLVELKSDNSSIDNENINLIEIKSEVSTNDASVENSSENNHQHTDNYSILSDEQYKELCLKYARDEKITEEELNLLLRSTPQLLENNQEDIEMQQSQDDFVHSERKVRGFTINSFSTYFVIISIIITLLTIFLIL